MQWTLLPFKLFIREIFSLRISLRFHWKSSGFKISRGYMNLEKSVAVNISWICVSEKEFFFKNHSKLSRLALSALQFPINFLVIFGEKRSFILQLFYAFIKTVLVSVSKLIFTFSKSTLKTLEKMWNMLKINNKNTRTTSSTSFCCFYN